MSSFMSRLTVRARMAFIGAATVIVLGGAAALWWASHPDYAVLFRDLKQSDAAEVTAALGQMQVPYRIADEGATILVPEAGVYDARMKLVSQGVPKGGSVGFELFKDSDYGVTEFAQRVNFQRALQGELERTIASMDEVSSTRVHLVIHRRELFAQDEESSKGSVALSLKPGRTLEARQVVGIQRLVASAVEGLVPESVVVLDGDGTLLSARNGMPGKPSMGDQLDDQSRLETQLRTKAEALLHQALPEESVTVSVDVRLNYDRVKQVREQLIPQGKDGNGLLVRERRQSSGHAGESSDSEPGSHGVSTNDQELEYAHGREQEEIERAPGRIERISVGVVMPRALADRELAKLSTVVAAGLGLDAARGDKVDIVSMAPFQGNHGLPGVTATVPTTAHDVGGMTVPDCAGDACDGEVVEHGLPKWAFLLLLLWALATAGLAIAVLRRDRPRRLTLQEREEALRQLRKWIAAPEAAQ